MKQLILVAAFFAIGSLPTLAHADYLLDTGTPNNSGFPLSLDGTDYAAAEFAVGAGQSIGSIQAFINGGNSGQAGDTFTIAIYAADGVNHLPGTSVFSGQATYQADGWSGLNNLNLSGLAPGNYWAAFEVGSSDSTAGLSLPINAVGGTAPALGFAFNDGSGYQVLNGESFGVQVAPVPLPGALILLASGLGMLGGSLRRRAPASS